MSLSLSLSTTSSLSHMAKVPEMGSKQHSLQGHCPLLMTAPGVVKLEVLGREGAQVLSLVGAAEIWPLDVDRWF